MNYSEKYTLALYFAKCAHQNQTYDNPGDYFDAHISRVVAITTSLTKSDDAHIIAFLHDVVEDTPITVDYLRILFGEYIAESVRLLTKDDNLSYEDNIKRIVDSGNLDAMYVKLADNLVNFYSDKSKMAAKRKEKLQARYKKSIDMLNEGIGNA